MSRKHKTIGEAWKEGKQRLRAAGKEAWAWEAELLLEKAAGLNRTAFFLREAEPLSEEAEALYETYLSQREQGRPTQYILGSWEFMGLPFFVGEGVLIPRADTECLVETILEKQKQEGFQTLLDIGTGSGCIPISLGKYGSFSEILAVDISPQALAYARKNAAENAVEIQFLESDLFSALPVQRKGNLDVIVSNPPYIPKRDIEGLMTEVKTFEPRNALDGGKDGLDFYRVIVAESKNWLTETGWLFFEIGYDQGEAVYTLLKEQGFTDVEVRQDLAGRDRVVCGKVCGKEE